MWLQPAVVAAATAAMLPRLQAQSLCRQACKGNSQKLCSQARTCCMAHLPLPCLPDKIKGHLCCLCFHINAHAME